MSNQVNNGGVTLPTAYERKQIFYWLKQISSYTAWNRILVFYRTWADTTENCARLASEASTAESNGGPANDYNAILKGLAHCEEASVRLKKGDKRIFKYDANGELAMANRPRSHWMQRLFRIEDREEPELNEDNTPGWTPFRQALENLSHAWGECSPDILESQYLDTASHTFCNNYLRETLNRITPPNPLPEVPTPKEVTLVQSGKHVPCSGIWEPVDAPKRNVFSLFRNNEPPAESFPIAGTMSYLHVGSNAPNMAAYGEELGLPTTWHLLWRDTRYEDGTIPEEERDYIFLKPDSTTEETRPVTSSAHEPFIWVESGHPAPQTGRWLAEHDLQTSVTLQVGEVLPLHRGRPTRWMLAQA